jgi:tryptophan synthase alpha subunit
MNPKTSPPNLGLFITAGFPSLNSLEQQLKLIDNHRVAFVEIGIPFSDPLADGPVIQQTSAGSVKKRNESIPDFSAVETDSIQHATTVDGVCQSRLAIRNSAIS